MKKGRNQTVVEEESPLEKLQTFRLIREEEVKRMKIRKSLRRILMKKIVHRNRS